MIQTSRTFWKPSEAQIDALRVGSIVPDCFGNFSEIVSIHCLKRDIHGALFLCGYVKFGGNGGTISVSFKAGELHRTVAICALANSAELDSIEREMADGEIRGYWPELATLEV